MKHFTVIFSLLCLIGASQCLLPIQEYVDEFLSKSNLEIDLIEKNPTLIRHFYGYFQEIYPKDNQKKRIDFKQKQRFEIFKANLIFILKHNQDPSKSYKLKLNELSDWTDQERDQLRSNIVNLPTNNEPQPSFVSARNDPSIPSQFDWTNQSRVPFAVTPVKDQRHCGSCYAFAMVGALEKTYAQIYNQSGPLSPQQLIDCSTENNACEGGSFIASFDYIRSIGFQLSLEKDYPSTTDGKQNNQCLKSNGSSLSFNSTFQLQYQQLPSENEEYMKQVLYEQGPIYFSFNCGKREGNDTILRQVSDAFDHYSTGVFDVPGCPTHRNMNHALVIVGYGNDNGTDFWKVKNSWGDQWGDQGYLKIKRNENMCGIASYPYSVGLFEE